MALELFNIKVGKIRIWINAEGGTEEYLWSQTTSVKLRGGSFGIFGKTESQSYAKYLYT